MKGCRETAPHLFVKQIPPTHSWHQVDSDRCNFLSSNASINPCFTAGKISGVGNRHTAWRHQKTTVCTIIVYGERSVGATPRYNVRFLQDAVPHVGALVGEVDIKMILYSAIKLV